MKSKIFILLTLLFIGVSGAFAQKTAKGEDLNAQVPIDKKVKIGKLENGLTYYIRANKKPENRVQFRLVTNAGSILEDDDQLGLAHFCEHMAFNGTKHYKGNEMISELQKNGIEFGRGINAWTSFDETVYYVELPADKPEMLEMGFKILDGWAGGLLFEGEEIEKERGVIIEEWRGGLGANERIMKASFPIILNGSKYANRLPIGTYESVKNFKHESIKRFYKDWYRPDLQAVVIVGDIDVNAMEAKVKEYFNGYAKRDNPRERPSFDIPTNKEPLVAIVTDKEATSTQITLFWKHSKAPHGTVGNYRESLVRMLVNGMLSARFSELCEKSESPMVAANGGYEGFLGRSCDAFALLGMPKDDQITETLKTLITEIKRADEHGFVQTELDRQKDEILSNFEKMFKERDKTHNNSFAQEYTNNFLEGEVIPGIMKEYKYAKEFIPEITLDEVNKLISEWITDENLVVWIQANEKVQVPTEKEVLRIISDMKNIQTTPYVDNYKEEPLFEKQLIPVEIAKTNKNEALDFTEYTLPNGVRFVVKKTNFKDDEILFRSYSTGGSSLYNDDEFLTANLAPSIVDQSGIANFSNSQLEKKLKGMNLAINPALAELSQQFSGYCSPKDFETVLQLTYLYYTEPRYDKDAFERFMSQLRTQFKFIGENPQYAFIDKLYKTAYPNNKRNIIVPTEEELNSVNYERAFQIYKDRFSDASNTTFFFVGNISDEMIPMIAKYLGNLPAKADTPATKWINRETPFAKGLVKSVAKKGTDNQGILVLMGNTKKFDPTPKNKLIVNMLNDAVTISALEVIREEMGSTYSPMVQISYEVLPESEITWMFYINCDPDRADEVKAALMKLVNNYIKKGPSEETLDKVKKQLISARETNLKENSFWSGLIYGSYFYGNDISDLYDYEKRVNAITVKDIRSMAKTAFDTKNFVDVRLVPENK